MKYSIQVISSISITSGKRYALSKFQEKTNLFLLNETNDIIAVLVDAEFDSGEHIYNFNVDSFPNGHYFLQLKADNVDMLRKISIQHS